MPKSVTLADVLPRPAGAPRGTAHGLAKLSDARVRKIRELHARGGAQTRLALAFGVSRSTIRRVVRRETWAHVED